MNYVLWAAVGPGAVPIWLCIFGSALILLRCPKAGMRLTLIGALLLFLTAVLPTGQWLLRPLELRYASPDFSRLSPKAIVVLTGGEALYASAQRGEPEFNHASERILTAVKLARQFPSAKLYLVGGISIPEGTTDTDVLYQAAVSLGIANNRIQIINGTSNTYENAQGAARQLRRARAGTALLVTSAYHMPRAMLCFEAANVTVIPVPVDYRASLVSQKQPSYRLALLNNLEQTDLALHEWAGLLLYRATGRTLRLWPAD